MNTSYGNKKIDTVVFDSKDTDNFTDRDWLLLAMAALDQAGVSVRTQETIEGILGVHDDG